MRTKKPLLALALLTAAGCGQNETKFESATPVVGTLDLALSINSEFSISAVQVAIQGEGDVSDVTRARSVNVADSNASVSAREGGLPAGSYSIALSANLDDNPETAFDESTAQCEGSVSGVAVAAGETTDASLVLLCTLDGGQLQVAGGLRVVAETAVERINQCPDLYSAASIAPLDTSVGTAVALGIDPIAGATVSWSATRGTVSADGSSYSCPDIPGDYTVTASVTTDDGCSQSFSEVVSCHSGYEGTCDALPSSFVWEGDCGLRSPCHLIEQDGCEWTASCRGQIVSGQATSATTFPFAYSRGTTQLDCSTELVDGELVGSCTNLAGDSSCSVNSNQYPALSASCDRLVDISSVTACGTTETNCDIIQDACSYQALCDSGTIRTGNVVGDALRWNMDDRATVGTYYRCEAPIVDGEVVGSCNLLRGEGAETCEDYSAQANVLDMGGCAATLPAAGFKLEGCGLDGVAFANQRECVWEIISETGTISGFAPTDNTYEFENAAGESCVGSVVDGNFSGSCGTGAAACSFATVAPAVDDSCFQLPDVVATRGCGFGAPTPFGVVQDGCDFYGFAPSRGVFVAGTATPTGITFPGIGPGWVCTADLNEEVGDELWGGCTRDNADGSVSQCRDLTSSQGSRLVIGLSL